MRNSLALVDVASDYGLQYYSTALTCLYFYDYLLTLPDEVISCFRKLHSHADADALSVGL